MGKLLTREQFLVSQGAQSGLLSASPRFVGYEPPRGKQNAANTKARQYPSCGLRFSNTLGKMGVTSGKSHLIGRGRRCGRNYVVRKTQEDDLATTRYSTLVC